MLKEIHQETAQFGKENRGIIDSHKDVGGWPILEKRKAHKDSDGDGMPDDWELENGLDPNDSSDSSNYDLDQNYTNIDVYLNSLVSHLFPKRVTNNQN
ncbi:thrombospondin type 3 repeat-containing protein [Aquiflexum sp.]|uniref:thrombospondin type 3 repeat-containing protein n=1 Tax=Aquiflexum sp. TaxID=1872584 RepID=UPI00359458DB